MSETELSITQMKLLGDLRALARGIIASGSERDRDIAVIEHLKALRATAEEKRQDIERAKPQAMKVPRTEGYRGLLHSTATAARRKVTDCDAVIRHLQIMHGIAPNLIT